MVKKLSDFRKQQAEKIAALEDKRSNEKVSATLSNVQKKLLDKLNLHARYKVISFKDIDFDNKQFQIRHGKTNLDDMKESLKTNGQQTAVFVRVNPANPGKYQIISGFSRTEVLTELKRDVEIKDYGKINDDEALQLAIIENVQRNELTPTDMIDLIDELKSKHPDITRKEISQVLGKKESMVDYYVKIGKFPDVLKMLTKQEITIRQAILMTELSDTERTKEMQKVAAENQSKKEGGDKGKSKTKSSLPAIIIDKKKQRGKITGFSFKFEEKADVLEKLKGFIEKIKEI